MPLLTGDGYGWDDPRTQAQMALAVGMMTGRIPEGFANAQQAFSEAGERQLRRGLLTSQLQAQQLALAKAQREADINERIAEAARNSMVSPEKANSLSMGPMPDGSQPQVVQPGFQSRQFLNSMYGIDPLRAIDFEAKLVKDESPLRLSAGEALYDRRTFKPIAVNPKDDSPAAIKEYQFARSQGYQGSFDQWDKERKRAGATNIAVNTERSFLSNVGEGLGRGITDARSGAQAALNTIGTVNRLMDALDSGQVVSGPGATFRQYGLQVGNILGVTGKDAQEKLLNTRQTIQSLAQLELDAAQQMKGQGQITEAERAIIRRAASGDIDAMTPPELRLLGGILDRTARTKIRTYQSQVKPLGQMPNASAIVPFLNVEEPPPRTGTGVRRFNPATGRIE